MELQKEKLAKMIKDCVDGKLELPIEAFKTLCKAYENVSNRIVAPAPISLNPPRKITINKPKNVFIVKNENMANCIKEMLSNEFFLRRKRLCERKPKETKIEEIQTNVIEVVH